MPIFPADLRTYVRTVLPKRTKFGTVTYVGWAFFYGSATPHPKGQVPASPKMSSLLHARTRYEKQQPNVSSSSSRRRTFI